MNSVVKRYEMPRAAYLQGSILSLLTQQVIQNEIATIVEQRLALTFDPLNPVQFAQDEALLKGQIQAFMSLLDGSDAAHQELLRQAQDAQSN